MLQSGSRVRIKDKSTVPGNAGGRFDSFINGVHLVVDTNELMTMIELEGQDVQISLRTAQLEEVEAGDD